MKHTQTAIILTIAAIWVSGCGTVCNLTSKEPIVPLGGVTTDLEVIKAPQSPYAPSPDKAQTLLFALDMPLSVVGDTLTWPVAYCLAKNAEKKASKQADTINASSASDKDFSTAAVAK